jgi:hypothetical protein
MLVTHRHHQSLSQASAIELSELQLIVRDLKRTLARLWPGPVLVFEHGSNAKSRSQCVGHAHVQIAPHLGPLAARILPPNATRLQTLDQLSAEFPTGGYMMTAVSGAVHVAPDMNLPSQYFRRRICELQGRRDEWDYLVFPRNEDMQVTIQLMEDALPSPLLTAAREIS